MVGNTLPQERRFRERITQLKYSQKKLRAKWLEKDVLISYFTGEIKAFQMKTFGRLLK